jgi:DNA-binding NarL/FixJ family response regulator
MRTSILLVDHNCLLRQGLRALLDADGEFEVIGEASNALQAIQRVLDNRPELMLIDSQLPGLRGIETIALIKRRVPGVRIVMLVDAATDDCLREPLNAGVAGHVLKDSSFQELHAALRCVAAGRNCLIPDAAAPLVDGCLVCAAQCDCACDPLARLTARERSILRLIVEGRTNRATAACLSVSEKTVEKHRANLMRKLGVHNAIELMFAALKMGMVEHPTPGQRLPSPVRFSADAAA